MLPSRDRFTFDAARCESASLSITTSNNETSVSKKTPSPRLSLAEGPTDVTIIDSSDKALKKHLLFLSLDFFVAVWPHRILIVGGHY